MLFSCICSIHIWSIQFLKKEKRETSILTAIHLLRSSSALMPFSVMRKLRADNVLTYDKGNNSYDLKKLN